MRWTKSSLVLLLPAIALACKSESKKLAEVRACSAITMDAAGAANCLVLQYKWKKKKALANPHRFQLNQNSVARFGADSGCRADAARHSKAAGHRAAAPR